MPRKPKVIAFGTDAFGLEMTGDPRNMEASHYRIVFPGGHLEVTRAQDNPNPDYWVHVYVNHKGSPSFDPDEPPARITDARLDLHDRSAGEVDIGDFDNPALYHLAVKVTHGAAAKIGKRGEDDERTEEPR